MNSKGYHNDKTNKKKNPNLKHQLHSNSSEMSSADGWKVVASGNKRKSPYTSPHEASTTKSGNGGVLEENAFFLPKALETKLHIQQPPKKKPALHVATTKKAAIDCQEPANPSFLSIMMKGKGANDGNNNNKDPDLEQKRNSRGKMRVKRRFDKGTGHMMEPIAAYLPQSWLGEPIPRKKAFANGSTAPMVVDNETSKDEMLSTVENLMDLPVDVLSRGILSYLGPKELLSLGACSSNTSKLAGEGFLWKALLKKDFPKSEISPVSETQCQMAYRVVSTNLVDRMRCFHTKKTFLEDVIGLGVDFTINPKTKRVDYISVSQDLTSTTAFEKQGRRSDVFGNKFKLFLPLYFSKEHFQRALPTIRRTIVKLCPDRKTAVFSTDMVLDVFPKMITTFVVLLCDEGISASQKSFEGFVRINRLFLALAEEYPVIKDEAARRLNRFINREDYRTKNRCPNLGQILPLLMVVNPNECSWATIRPAYLQESMDRSVLWVCKKHPHLERIIDVKKGPGFVESIENGRERVALTRDAMAVPLRLIMFHVYFLRTTCNGTVTERSARYDANFFKPRSKIPVTPVANEVHQEANEEGSGSQPVATTPPAVAAAPKKDADSLSFDRFRDEVGMILGISTWQAFFNYVGLVAPRSIDDMAQLLRSHVKNSRRKKYHKSGMDFSRVHASGSSKILAKGQEYTACSGLRRVVFEDHWGFQGRMKYLDATCILYSGKKRVDTIDYNHTWGFDGAVQHSGDVMDADRGTHTININLQALPASVTSCVFVLSAWNDATLADIISPTIRFRNSEADPSADPLCVYDLDSHDKISHLKSVIMCKLYRSSRATGGSGGGWHVLAVGDSHEGCADNYGPIYKAVEKLL